MNLQPWIKLPFRIARAVYREVRDTVVDAPRSPEEPAQTASPAPPTAPAAPAPAPAAARAPVAVRVEVTPNPDALKFVCDSTVVAQGSLAINGPDEARGHPFAEALTALDGVRTVFATRDFVTVTRHPDGPGWDVLEPEIARVLSVTVGATR